GLGPPLAPASGRRLSRIGQMGAVAGPLDLLDHEPPAGRALERELSLTAGELRQPGTHLGPRRRRDPTTPHLTRLAVERLVGDLPSMHIQRHYDFHRDLLELRRTRHRVTTTLETRGSHYMSSLYEESGLSRRRAPVGMEHLWSRADANPPQLTTFLV